MAQDFRELKVWNDSLVLTKDIYAAFNGCKDFSFRDQIQRASVSVMNNIAEGSSRKSQKSFISYLQIAEGSTAEVKSMLILALELRYLDEVLQERLFLQADKISARLHVFVAKLKADG